MRRRAGNHRHTAPATRRSIRSRMWRTGRSCERALPAPSNDAGEHEGRDDGVATARLAVSLLLVGLHLGRVVAALLHADRRAHAVGDRRGKQIVETVEPFGLAELQVRGQRTAAVLGPELIALLAGRNAVVVFLAGQLRLLITMSVNIRVWWCQNSKGVKFIMLNHFVICRLIQAHHNINRRRHWQSQPIPLPIRRVQNRTRWDEIRPNWPSLFDNLISSHFAFLSYRCRPVD